MNELKYFIARVEGDSSRYILNLGEHPFHYGGQVIFKGLYGITLGTISSFLFDKIEEGAEVVKLIGYASEKDLEKNKNRENMARLFRNEMREKAQEMQLEMNITHVLYPLATETLAIFYTAKDRVDFRDFLVWLREHFKKRIVLRQISAEERGEAIAHYSSLGQLQGASEIHRR